MFSPKSIQVSASRAGRIGRFSVAVVVSLAAAGCSANISRFDLGSYSLNGDEATGSNPVPSASMANRSIDGRIGQKSSTQRVASFERKNSARLADRSAGGATDRRSASRSMLEPVQSSRLADAGPAEPNRNTAYRQPTRRLNRVAALPKTRTPVAVPAASSHATTSGQRITVRRGDTLYGLARRHSVSISGLMEANGLSGPMIRPGQKLVLPGVDDVQTRPAKTPRRQVATRRTTTAAPVAQGGYIVRPGDSFYRIARQHGMRTAALRAANPGVDPRRLRPGQTVNIPGGDTSARRNAGTRRIASAPVAQPPRVVNTVRSTRINKPKSTRNKSIKAARPGVRSFTPKSRVAVVAPPAARSTAGKFRWPVRGRIIAKFGTRKDGTHNDGINISVPAGTQVMAAENGVVAYAGSELKGYGKLILVRHAGNWVTAYAHNSSIMVKRGDKIRRGQVIAKAGKTGTVDQPQLHFELRKGSKPVNPMPLLR